MSVVVVNFTMRQSLEGVRGRGAKRRPVLPMPLISDTSYPPPADTFGTIPSRYTALKQQMRYHGYLIQKVLPDPRQFSP